MTQLVRASTGFEMKLYAWIAEGHLVCMHMKDGEAIPLVGTEKATLKGCTSYIEEIMHHFQREARLVEFESKEVLVHISPFEKT